MKKATQFLLLLLLNPLLTLAQNVGIGTTTPAFKLDVQGRMRIKAGTPGNVLTSAGVWMDDYRDGSNRFFFGMKDSIRAGFYGGGTGGKGWDFTFNTQTGNVGIGYLDPTYYKLSIDGEIGLYKTILGVRDLYGSFTSNAGDLILNAKLGNLLVGTNPQNLIMQYDGGGFGNISGKVGIGLADPLVKLHINGSGEICRLSNGSTAIQMGSDYMQYMNSNVGKFFMQLIGNNFTISNSSGNNTGILTLNGNRVTIGQITAANCYKLSVGGKVICEEVRVQLQGAWPDYVFNKNYKLKSLDELRDYISQNNHLPNIPAASEMEQNGIALGDMQKKMMEKIEELTLYILQLQQEIKQIKKEIPLKK